MMKKSHSNIDPELDSSVRGRLEYEEGKNAYASLYGPEHCQYGQSTPERMSWLCGWYDARTNDRLKEVFERYNITFP